MDKDETNGCCGCGCIIIILIILASSFNFVPSLIIIGIVIFVFLAIVGFFVDLFTPSKKNNGNNNTNNNSSSYYQNRYTLTPADSEKVMHYFFMLSGYIARGQGRIDENQIESISKKINEITDDHDKKIAYQNDFNIGKNDYFNPDEICNELNSVLKHLPKIKINILDFLINIIFIDGVMEDDEYTRIKRVSSNLNIPDNLLESLIRQNIAQQQFRRGFYNRQRQYEYSRQNNDQDDQEKQYSNNNYGYGNNDSGNQTYDEESNIANAYQVLGLNDDVSFNEVRSKYHKLMNRYHPDHLAQQGLSPEMVKKCTEKAQVIQEAYDILKKHYGQKR